MRTISTLPGIINQKTFYLVFAFVLVHVLGTQAAELNKRIGPVDTDSYFFCINQNCSNTLLICNADPCAVQCVSEGSCSQSLIQTYVGETATLYLTSTAPNALPGTGISGFVETIVLCEGPWACSGAVLMAAGSSFLRLEITGANGDYISVRVAAASSIIYTQSTSIQFWITNYAGQPLQLYWDGLGANPFAYLASGSNIYYECSYGQWQCVTGSSVYCMDSIAGLGVYSNECVPPTLPPTTPPSTLPPSTIPPTIAPLPWLNPTTAYILSTTWGQDRVFLDANPLFPGNSQYQEPFLWENSGNGGPSNQRWFVVAFHDGNGQVYYQIQNQLTGMCLDSANVTANPAGNLVPWLALCDSPVKIHQKWLIVQQSGYAAGIGTISPYSLSNMCLDGNPDVNNFNSSYPTPFFWPCVVSASNHQWQFSTTPPDCPDCIEGSCVVGTGCVCNAGWTGSHCDISTN